MVWAILNVKQDTALRELIDGHGPDYKCFPGGRRLVR
jgi:hypothetical protein